jgi:hypothetical protein
MISLSHWGMFPIDWVPSGYSVTFDFGNKETLRDSSPLREVRGGWDMSGRGYNIDPPE